MCGLSVGHLNDPIGGLNGHHEKSCPLQLVLCN
jgi:hypothetical protein